MDSPRQVDLERELTCSICTEILYQPLTLLDCLHTFCGSCLKDWFSFQAIQAERSPHPRPAGSSAATCPSCRAPVRGTRHNATVATLLDMFLSANPEKARPDEDKEEMNQKYKPGDNVLPKPRASSRSPEEQRLEQLERRMLEQARELSLQDAGVGPSHARHRPRQHSEGRHRSHEADSEDSSSRGARDRSRRSTQDGERRHRTNSSGVLSPEPSSSDERARRRSGSQQRSRDSSRTRRRAVEHQSSIRSLLSSSDVDSSEMEREIEEFARQIQEEGLLDGLDLDNIDLTQNDELSRKITEAYRRRQAQRSRQESARRSNVSSHSHRSEVSSTVSRPPRTEDSRSTSRQRAYSAHARSTSSTSQLEDRSRPPVTSTHLEVRPGPGRHRRSTSSGGRSARSATEPIRPSTAETRPAARSQTDLTLRSQNPDQSVQRPTLAGLRSSSIPLGGVGEHIGTGRPFSERAAAAQSRQNVLNDPPSPQDTSSEPADGGRTKHRPESLVSMHPNPPLPSLGLPASPRSSRQRSQFYYEPSITCNKCGRLHIEYELHYNCSKCNSGNWNICMNCYRTSTYRTNPGCAHWFGFGYSAFNNWEKARGQRGDHALEPPHMLTANRYSTPRIAPGGADGRRTMTTEDPEKRHQSGMFCARCQVWTNGCYWRCDLCNEGDWGFCNDCVNQGRSCTHALLPLTYVAPPGTNTNTQTPPASPRSPHPPPSASLFTGPSAFNSGNFKPLTFTTTCDICRAAIVPTQRRYHCYTCTSTVVPDTHPGDYDICSECYTMLVADEQISAENGHHGWRRCLNGHRMVVISFLEGSGGQRRHIDQDLVGGWDLHTEPYEDLLDPNSSSQLQKWWWYGPERAKRERLVDTNDVSATAPTPPGQQWTDRFPPDGGVGMRASALWSWYPQIGAEDELLFPKGAEIRECEDVNRDWFFGVYMGAKGLFPAPYVRVLER